MTAHLLPEANIPKPVSEGEPFTGSSTDAAFESSSIIGDGEG
ncbi:MAG: hypothetical protein ACFB20_03530 [Opitutales bacterium]